MHLAWQILLNRSSLSKIPIIKKKLSAYIMLFIEINKHWYCKKTFRDQNVSIFQTFEVVNAEFWFLKDYLIITRVKTKISYTRFYQSTLPNTLEGGIGFTICKFNSITNFSWKKPYRTKKYDLFSRYPVDLMQFLNPSFDNLAGFS